MEQIKQEIGNWTYFSTQFNACVILRELNKLQKRIQELKKEVVEEIKYNEEHKEIEPECITCYVFEELDNMLCDFDWGNGCPHHSEEICDDEDICDDCRKKD